MAGAPLLYVHSLGLLSQAISLNTVFCFGAHLGRSGDGLATQDAAEEVDRTKEQVRTIEQRRRRRRCVRQMKFTLQRAVLYFRYAQHLLNGGEASTGCAILCQITAEC